MESRVRTGIAYRLNLADNRLPISDQSRLPIPDILSVLSFTDILEIADISGENHQYITDTYLEPIFSPKPITDRRYFIGPDFYQY